MDYRYLLLSMRSIMGLIRFWPSWTSRPGEMVDTHGIETYHAADRGMSGNRLALRRCLYEYTHEHGHVSSITRPLGYSSNCTGCRGIPYAQVVPRD